MGRLILQAAKRRIDASSSTGSGASVRRGAPVCPHRVRPLPTGRRRDFVIVTGTVPPSWRRPIDARPTPGRARWDRTSHCCTKRQPIPTYHLLNHITLRLKDGATQIDHILVSRFVCICNRDKTLKGWIFANPKHATWTQAIFKRKFKCQYPIFQNLRHVRAAYARNCTNRRSRP